jgi:type II secretory pathway component GspD/PulD (secretin)
LRTSSRLLDGQALVIGGLLTNDSSSNATGTPGLSRVPIIGWFFQGSNRNDESTELVIVVTPVVLRAPIADAAMWEFPNRSEMLRPLLADKAPAAKR